MLFTFCKDEPPVFIAVCIVVLMFFMLLLANGIGHAVGKTSGHFFKTVQILIVCIFRIIVLIINRERKKNNINEDVGKRIDSKMDDMIVNIMDWKTDQHEKKETKTPTLEAETHSKSGFIGWKKRISGESSI